MNRIFALLSSLVLLSLTSCNLLAGVGRSQATQQALIQYQTEVVILTQTGQVGALPLHTPSPSLRGTPSATTVFFLTFTPLPTATLTSLLTREPTDPSVPCDLAQAGRPIDVSIPDDTEMKPGENFSKTWRLVNVGSCTWDSRYAVVWFSGADLGLSQAQGFSEQVLPGKAVDITLEMVAPFSAGVYQSNWKLRNPQGMLFGIGPGGGSPFWVRIVVIPEDTPTPTPVTPTPTPFPTSTPVPYISGVVLLTPMLTLDIDSGDTGVTGDAVDLILNWPENQPGSLAPQNGALWLPVNNADTDAARCAAEPLQEPDPQDPILIDNLEVGTSLCLRSSQGRPGLLVISQIQPVERQIVLEYTTWTAP
jgi:hypothetical protein